MIEAEDPLPPPPKSPYFSGFSWAMYGNAHWQLSHSQHAAGVLLAQVAVEMGVRLAFIALFVQHPTENHALGRLKALPDVSFMSDQTRAKWTDLTGGDRVDEPENVWNAYRKHVQLRNRIAHGDDWGNRRGGEDAWKSWRAAGTFIARLDAVMVGLASEP